MPKGLHAKSMNRALLWRCLPLWFFCTLLSSFAFAIDRDRTLSQLHHTAWTAKDGAPSQISALAQTEDGYLWIGSARGLYKFDGVEFTQYLAPADRSFPSHNVSSLLSTSDGGLWISFRPAGLAFLKAGPDKSFFPPRRIAQS